MEGGFIYVDGEGKWIFYVKCMVRYIFSLDVVLINMSEYVYMV